jgi:uncharacterized protein YkwD
MDIKEYLQKHVHKWFGGIADEVFSTALLVEKSKRCCEWHRACSMAIVKLLVILLNIIVISFSASAGDLADDVLAEINLARTAPQEYAQIVAKRTLGYRGVEGEGVVREAIRFLEKQRPLPPLAVSEGIRNSALTHVLDMGPVGGRGHKGSNGSQPWDRMARFGKWVGRAGENIDYGQRDARAVVVRLIVDDGVRSRGHRKNIFSRDFRVAGAASGFHATYGGMCVIAFAGGFVETADRVASRTVLPAASL